MISKSQQKRIAIQKGLPDPFAKPEELKKIPPRRYYIDSDGDHRYFVEVENEGEFQQWLNVQVGNIKWQDYKGHDYEKNRIDGRFTFTDPRNE